MMSINGEMQAINTALLVIDVQEFVLNPANHPSRPWFYQRIKSTVAPTLSRLLHTCRSKKIEVVYTVMENLTLDGRDRSIDYKLSGFHIPKGSVGASIPSPFTPIGDELVFRKSSACLWHSTNASYVLRNMNIQHIACCGFLTDQCVEQIMKMGASLGFNMSCIENACATDTKLRHEHALYRISSFGICLQDKEWIEHFQQ